MSKKRVLVFRNNRLPRLLKSPPKEVLDQYPSDQVVKGNMKFLRGLNLHELVLDNGAVRKANKEELKSILADLESHRKNKDLVIKNASLKDKVSIVVNFKDQLEMVVKDIGIRESIRMEGIVRKQGLFTLVILVAIAALIVK